jgi:hypothetical protein
VSVSALDVATLEKNAGEGTNASAKPPEVDDVHVVVDKEDTTAETANDNDSLIFVVE